MPDETIQVGERHVPLADAWKYMHDAIGSDLVSADMIALCWDYLDALCREAREAARLREGIGGLLAEFTTILDDDYIQGRLQEILEANPDATR